MQAAERYHVQSRLASRVGRRVLQRETGATSRGILRKTSPSRLRLRRSASATVARGRGRPGLVHEAPATKRFGRLEGAVTATTQPSPRNCPESCSQREPKRAKVIYVRSANLRRVVCGALDVVTHQKGLITQGRWFKSSPRNHEIKGFGNISRSPWCLLSVFSGELTAGAVSATRFRCQAQPRCA